MTSIIRGILYNKPSIEWFLDIVYVLFLVSALIAVPYAIIVLSFGLDIVLFGLVWAFVMYCAIVYLIVRTYTVVRYFRAQNKG